MLVASCRGSECGSESQGEVPMKDIVMFDGPYRAQAEEDGKHKNAADIYVAQVFQQR